MIFLGMKYFVPSNSDTFCINRRAWFFSISPADIYLAKNPVFTLGPTSAGDPSISLAAHVKYLRKKNIFKEYDVTLETDIDTKCFFFAYITRSCCWLISKTQRHTSEGAKCMCSHFYLKLNETESFCLLALVAVH